MVGCDDVCGEEKNSVKDYRSKVVLITGASSGIGRATAELLFKKGHIIFGTSRKASFANLKNVQDQINMIPLDVTNQESVEKVFDNIIRSCGKLDVLINSAGYGFAGSVIDAPLSEMKRIFETNFFGQVRVIQTALRYLLRQSKGLIINMSSLAGRFSLPFQSFYSCTKFSIEAISESLQMELKALNSRIKVVIVEPADIATKFTQSRTTHYPIDSFRREVFKKVLEKIELDEKKGSSSETVAEVIAKIVETEKPRFRYVAGKGAGLVKLAYGFLPEKVFMNLLLKHYFN